MDAGISKERLRYPIVVLALLRKDTDMALKLLNEATQKEPSDVRYWTMLADVLLSQGDVQSVEFRVLPAMQKSLLTPNHYLIHAVRGCLLKKKGPNFYKDARSSLLNALSQNADLADIWDALLELDVAINDPDFKASDARNLLRVEPDHALANYLMGTVLLERGALPEAEDFFKRSIEKKPTAAACNDLAEDLRRQKKLNEAESFARRALELEPKLPPALDTLACILLDDGKADEAVRNAKEAVESKTALSLSTYQLTLLRAQVKLGNKNGVRESVKILMESKTSIPDALQKEINQMK